ncbi:hypothetical protein [Rhodospirillum rubrum]|uniref:hypothetical protein n=1 Tax=Rhodospirillum rubrum TaxID=1085 RepID=UPI001F5C436E|nr:hypothetical protein [Rhodospirillum rubrum]
MDSLEQDHDGNAGLGGGHSLFLSLYLLLLAFFIALVSVSIPEQPRAQAVVDSLTKTFSRFALARTDGMISERDAQAAAAGRFVAEAGALFQADLPGAQASRLAGGEVLDVILRADLLFKPNEAALIAGRSAFLDRLGATLLSAPAGTYRHLEIALSTGGASDAPLPGAESLEQRRAATLAGALRARGVRPTGLAVGLVPGPLGLVTLTFRLLPMPGEGEAGR